MKNVVQKNIPLSPSLAHKPYANMPSLKLWQLEKGGILHQVDFAKYHHSSFKIINLSVRNVMENITLFRKKFKTA